MVSFCFWFLTFTAFINVFVKRTASLVRIRGSHVVFIYVYRVCMDDTQNHGYDYCDYTRVVSISIYPVVS